MKINDGIPAVYSEVQVMLGVIRDAIQEHLLNEYDGINIDIEVIK